MAAGVEVVKPETDSTISRWQGRCVHALRLGALVLVVWLIRDQHIAWQRAQSLLAESPLTLAAVAPFFENAASLGAQSNSRGAVTVFDEADRPLGYVVQTAPISDSIVGYSGPTNTLIAFDATDRVVGIQVLQSADTIEHVEDVVHDEAFMTALVGRDWQSAGNTETIDAVSGASLTSLAILEGIAARLVGSRPSLRFPDDVTIDELEPMFATATELVPRSGTVVFDVLDSQGTLLGTCLRTSPAADDEMGYQGPTDTLIAFGPTGQVVGIRLRKSYDNDPYVGYVRDDEYFLNIFNGQSLDGLAELDLEVLGVEGVSGATMTSMSVAYGLSKAARAARLPTTRRRPRFIWSGRDTGTVAIVVFALLICFTRLRGARWVRIGFQLTLIGYFGFLNGDLLSQALFVGWAQSGSPWRLAPGLVALTAVAFLVPALTKKQVYCHHICPFGAAQQLVRIDSRRRARLPSRLVRFLKLVPAVLLLVVILTAMRHWKINLAGIEPFDAFLFWIAGAASISLAVGGLVAARFVPMAYCRFGCPTGAVLNFVRFHSRNERLTKRDALAVALLVVAVVARFM